MSYQKQPQPQLNGAYYGPPIPPPAQTYHRPGRGGGRGCCCLFDCLFDCGCCLLSCVFKIIFSILIVIGLIILVFWLIVRPHELKFYASDASLSTFNFTSGNSNNLNYNLAVNFTVRNPNRHIAIYYDQIQANAYYEEVRFSSVPSVTTFYQGHKNTSEFGPVVFKGQNLVMLGSDEVSDYNKQRSNGVYEIEVKLNLNVKFKLGLFKTGTYKPKIKCDLKVPINGGKSSEPFKSTRCDYDL